jgi:hypothetical protein
MHVARERKIGWCLSYEFTQKENGIDEKTGVGGINRYCRTFFCPSLRRFCLERRRRISRGIGLQILRWMVSSQVLYGICGSHVRCTPCICLPAACVRLPTTSRLCRPGASSRSLCRSGATTGSLFKSGSADSLAIRGLRRQPILIPLLHQLTPIRTGDLPGNMRVITLPGNGLRYPGSG